MAIVSCVGIVNNLDSIDSLDTDNCKSVLPHFTLVIFAMIPVQFFHP